MGKLRPGQKADTVDPARRGSGAAQAEASFRSRRPRQGAAAGGARGASRPASPGGTGPAGGACPVPPSNLAGGLPRRRSDPTVGTSVSPRQVPPRGRPKGPEALRAGLQAGTLVPGGPRGGLASRKPTAASGRPSPSRTGWEKRAARAGFRGPALSNRIRPPPRQGAPGGRPTSTSLTGPRSARGKSGGPRRAALACIPQAGGAGRGGASAWGSPGSHGTSGNTLMGRGGGRRVGAVPVAALRQLGVEPWVSSADRRQRSAGRTGGQLGSGGGSSAPRRWRAARAHPPPALAAPQSGTQTRGKDCGIKPRR